MCTTAIINHVLISSLRGTFDVEEFFCHTTDFIFRFAILLTKPCAYISPASGLSLVYVNLCLGIAKNYILEDG